MTATDELRKLLDERGVEWKSITQDLRKTNPEQRDFRTVWEFNNIQHEADEDMSIPKLHISTYGFLTPEQAIAATQGTPEIVRCRDCRYMHTVRHWLGMDVDECWLHADRESGAFGKEPTEPDGFCAWGERRDA